MIIFYFKGQLNLGLNHRLYSQIRLSSLNYFYMMLEALNNEWVCPDKSDLKNVFKSDLNRKKTDLNWSWHFVHAAQFQ